MAIQNTNFQAYPLFFQKGDTPSLFGNSLGKIDDNSSIKDVLVLVDNHFQAFFRRQEEDLNRLQPSQKNDVQTSNEKTSTESEKQSNTDVINEQKQTTTDKSVVSDNKEKTLSSETEAVDNSNSTEETKTETSSTVNEPNDIITEKTNSEIVTVQKEETKSDEDGETVVNQYNTIDTAQITDTIVNVSSDYSAKIYDSLSDFLNPIFSYSDFIDQLIESGEETDELKENNVSVIEDKSDVYQSIEQDTIDYSFVDIIVDNIKNIKVLIDDKNSDLISTVKSFLGDISFEPTNIEQMSVENYNNKNTNVETVSNVNVNPVELNEFKNFQDVNISKESVQSDVETEFDNREDNDENKSTEILQTINELYPEIHNIHNNTVEKVSSLYNNNIIDNYPTKENEIVEEIKLTPYTNDEEFTNKENSYVNIINEVMYNTSKYFSDINESYGNIINQNYKNVTSQNINENSEEKYEIDNQSFTSNLIDNITKDEYHTEKEVIDVKQPVDIDIYINRFETLLEKNSDLLVERISNIFNSKSNTDTLINNTSYNNQTINMPQINRKNNDAQQHRIGV